MRSLSEPVGHCALLAPLVLRQGRTTALLVEAHGTARRLLEVVGANLTAVDHAEHEPVCDRGPQFLHQVQRQGGPPRAERVQVAHLGIEANAFERRFALGAEQRVAERQERVRAVPRGTPGTALRRERGPIRADHPPESSEVGPRRDALEPTQHVEIARIANPA